LAIIAISAIAIASYALPVQGLFGAAFAGSKVSNSGNVNQDIQQSNTNVAENTGAYGHASASDNTQVNSASNNADVHIKGGKVKDSGNVHQSIIQSNVNEAINHGDHGSATADHNTQVNSASNNADVHIKGYKVKDSGNVHQSISQSNTNVASNSGDHGSADASHNTQVNSASNNADVHIKK
jgi:hypothetical protein